MSCGNNTFSINVTSIFLKLDTYNCLKNGQSLLFQIRLVHVIPLVHAVSGKQIMLVKAQVNAQAKHLVKVVFLFFSQFQGVIWNSTGGWGHVIPLVHVAIFSCKIPPPTPTHHFCESNTQWLVMNISTLCVHCMACII